MEHPVAQSHERGISIFLHTQSAPGLCRIRTIEVLAETVAFADQTELRPEEVHASDEVAVGIEDVDLCLRLRKTVVREDQATAGLRDALAAGIDSGQRGPRAFDTGPTG